MKQEYVLVDYFSSKFFVSEEILKEFNTTVRWVRYKYKTVVSDELVITLTEDEAIIFNLKYGCIKSAESHMAEFSRISDRFKEMKN